MEAKFTKAIDILYLAKQQGVEIVLNGDQLQLKIPKGTTLDKDLLKELGTNKQLIIDFLSNDNWKSTVINNENYEIKRFDRDEVKFIPLSFSQERLWFIDRLKGSLEYHLPSVLRLNGMIDRDSLSKTLREVVNRHEILRTVYEEENGQVYQRIKSVGNWILKESDGNIYQGDPGRLEEYIQQLIREPFDLRKDDMLRAELISIGTEDHILVVIMHHIAADAFSVPVLVREVAALYEDYSSGKVSPLPALGLQFADYAVWQRNLVQGDFLEEKLNYWKEKLEDVPALQLPTDLARSSDGGVYGSTMFFEVDTLLSQAIQSLSQAHGATLYMTLLAAFKVLLYRYSGQEDICVGTSVANRPEQELDDLIGFFVNTLALRDQVRGEMSFVELLQSVKDTTRGAYRNQEVPFEKVVDAVVKERQAGLSPLFQVMLVLNNTPEVPEIKLGDLVLSNHGYEYTTTKFDLTFFITASKGGFRGMVQYNTDLYSESRIQKMATHFKELLTSIVTAPETQVGKLEILSKEEKDELQTFEESKVSYPKDKTIAELFEEQAKTNPDTIAVAFEEQQLSYKALNERANQLAHYLQSKGVKENTLVPLLLERGADMLTGILGILKAGGAYVPVDTDFPQDRITYMLEDTKATVVVTTGTVSHKLPQNTGITIIALDEEKATLRQQPTITPTTDQEPNHLAYIIYTSGSTGKPKGVEISNSNIADYVYGLEERIKISESKSFALVSSIATDLGNTVLYGSLLTGGTLHVFSKETVSHIEAIHAYFDKNEIDCLKIVPSHWKALTLDNQPLLPKKQLIFGGEALQRTVVETIQNTKTNCKIINHYGPTETTIGKLVHEVDKTKKYGQTIPIGKPFSNTKTYILTKELTSTPIGVPGQLYIAGDGLAKGYLNNKELTKEKFISHPTTKERLYATGDKVQYEQDGNITFIGRVDDQVKIRGYRVEPGEIGRILEQSQQVKQAIVLARDDKQGNKQLIGYIVANDNYDKQELQDYLKEQLPDYMIPAHITALTAFPLTANGKIDRRALPDPEAAPTEQYTAPQNETEAKLKAIWEEVLEEQDISITADFFELGGHSLLAVRLISMIRKQFGMELPISEVFDYPTVEKLATRLTNEASTDILPPVTAETPRPEYIPLSFSQERLWFIDQLEGSAQYNLPSVLRLKGELNQAVLENTLRALVNRHEVLRTTIHEHEGQGYQLVMPANKWTLGITSKAYKEGTPELSKYIAELVSTPFDFSRDYTLRAELITISQDDHILVVTMHHIASDGWSRAILVKEVMALYEALISGQEAKLPELPVQYADYAIWQRKYVQGEVLDKKLNYWKTKLDDAATLELPADYPRPAIQRLRGAMLGFDIDESLSAQVNTLSQNQGATLYMTLLAAFNVLLSRYSGQEDICVGTTVAGRPQQELEGLIGFFINTLTLRNEVKGATTFADLLKAIKKTTLEAYAHQEVPFEKVVDAVVKGRDTSRNPLFQVLFSLQNAPERPELKIGGLTLSGEGQEHNTSRFDIAFMVKESAKGIHVSLEYNTDLYSKARIQKMATHFKELLQSIVTAPETQVGKLEILTKAEKDELQTFEESKVSYPKDKTIAELFEEQAKTNPDTIAVAFEEQQLSYKALNERANQLAHYLQSKGVKENTLVPLLTERGPDMLTGILGILKAGGAYVPVDTDFPQDRITYMLEDTKATVVVTTGTVSHKLPQNTGITIIELDEEKATLRQQPTITPTTDQEPNHLAYIIYTSGSTGKPKGVEISHSNIADYVYGLEERIKISESKSFALVSSIATDLGNTVLYGSLLTGGTLHVFSKETVSHIEAIHAYFDKNEIDCLKIVPSHWKALTLDNQPLLPKKQLIFGGEALQRTVVETIQNTKTNCKIINHYGPTETTIGKLVHEVDQTKKYGPTIPIGKPFSNTKTYILTKELTSTPIGVPGQLYIAGDGIAKGYLNNKELTKEKFISHPTTKERIYATGDKVQYEQDGNITFIGRVDDQVKIRGYRVEPGEIGRILEQSEQVTQAIVLARDDKQGNKQLIGYIVANDNYDKQELQDYLKEQLPDYMIPAHITELTAFPLTANGKIDRRALPDPEAAPTEQYTAPQNETEAKLKAIWEEVLEEQDISITADFFELGGHSLLAVRLISQIRKQFGMELPISEVFDYPTVEKLATRLTNEASTGILPPVTAEMPRPAYIPLSFSQERLWFIDRLEGSVQYHVPTVLRLKGELNKVALAYAFQTIVTRHEALRTVILENEDQGYQHILPADKWTIAVTKASTEEEENLSNDIAALINKPFDLSADYMLRADLIKFNEDDHILVITMHHIVSDGWSRSIMVKEVIELYTAHSSGQVAQLPGLPVQYADYAIWQRKYMQGEVLENKLGYWKTKLNGIVPLQLPTDYSRPLVLSSRGATRSFKIEHGLLSQIIDLSSRHGATTYMTLLAAFNVLLYRYSGQEDICVGAPIIGRNQQELEGLIGFFLNTLALRNQVSGDMPFSTLLQQVKTTTLEAYGNQEVPFEKVVDAIVKDRDMSRNPLFQVLFSLQNTPEVPELKLGNLQLSVANQEHVTAKFDLAFLISESNSNIHGVVEYSTDLYREDTIAAMIGHYLNLLGAITAAPEDRISRLELLTDAEEITLKQFNATSANYTREKNIVSLFEEQAAKSPEAKAIIFGEEELTYKQLNDRSNQLAHYLTKKGVKAETLVPICVERSAEMVIGILGILKAGGAYVPIDPEYPQDRISYMLEDTGAKLVLSSKASREKLNEGVSVIELDGDWQKIKKETTNNPGIFIKPEQLAYVIYTSGSTGRPKGVQIEHQNTNAFIAWCRSEFSNSKFDIVYATTSICFDLSVFELFYPLSIGKPVRILENGLAIPNYLKADTAVLINTVPSVVESLLDEKTDLSSISVINMAGEPIPSSVSEKLDTINTEVRNLYGPTEDTTYSTIFRLEQGKPVLIGKPIANTQVHILSRDNELTPIGVSGEICISGAGLARGYLNKSELTEEKFIQNPFNPKERLYKTGDLGRWLPDGNIEYQGRIDDQVKIRGFRIELGEIESVLSQSGLVTQSVVLAKEDSKGNKRLVGYVVAKEFEKQAVQAYLSTKLPEYMVPALWVELTTIPLTPNGKTDKKALPDPELADITVEYVAPRNETEQALADIWQELLGIEQAGIYDNFFEIGGHSLLAMRGLSAIRRKLDVELNIRDMFVYPTIAGLAGYIQQQSKGALLPAITAEDRPEYIPLSFSQERLWFIDRLEGSVQYHMPAVLHMQGEVDREQLERALRAIINRHEILRTVILEHEGQGYQHVMGADNWFLEVIQESAYKEGREGLSALIKSLIGKPFDLSRDYMLRANLVSIGSDEYILAVTIHHVASDGWSRSILVKEVVKLYQGYTLDVQTDLPELAIQFADYAIWQRKYLQGELLESKLSYWKTKLDGVVSLQLPTDYSRPPVQRLLGAQRNFRITKELSDGLVALSRQEGATLYMTMLAAFNVLMYRYSGQEDICIGTGIAGRQQQELEGLIGFFVNTMALRNEVNGDMPFTTFLQAVKTTMIEAYKNQEVPFEKVVDLIVKERDLSRNPLIQVLFLLQNTPDIPELKLDAVKISLYKSEHITSRFDLTFAAFETPEGLEVSLEYNTDLFKEETIERMMDHYRNLLHAVVLNPETLNGQLAMLSRAEETTLMQEFNNTLAVYPKDKSIVDLFEEQVRKTPEAVAIVFEQQQLNYNELNDRSNQLARYLTKRGMKAEMLVPICIERGLEMIWGILGILKAGGVYVPIDPEYPADRISYMLEDTAAEVVLSSSSSRSNISDGTAKIIELDGDWEQICKEDKGNIDIKVLPNQLAYVIYTSGSTGKPKGVLIEHYNVVRLFKTEPHLYDFNDKDVWTMFHSFCFDFSVWEMYGALLYGGKLIVVPKDVTRDTLLFSELILKEKVTVLNQTPSAFYNLQDTFSEKRINATTIRYVIFGGEALNPGKLQFWRQTYPDSRLVNMYGITETTVHVTYQEIEWVNIEEGKSVIGKPIPTLSVYILNKNHQLEPVGIAGELYVGGAGLARGYLNRPELTAQRFISDPISKEPKARLYKTGDLGRWLADGSIEYLGRIDDQVKIRGFRIELGEIENALNQCDQVTQAVVLAKEDGNGDKRLLSYYVPDWQFVKIAEQAHYQQQVASWKEVYESEYGQTEDVTGVDEEFNIIGWNDSFTGLPIPAENMRVWLDDIIDLILSENPRNVLEIGCGTGLIFYQLAGKVEKYLGVDLSRSSVNQITARINKGLRDYGPVELWVSPAHSVTLPKGEQVDTILLNSIIQYFPGEGYMDEVLARAISLLDGTGRIIVGDVRDNRLLGMFKTRLEMPKLQSSVNIQELSWATQQEILKEEELCLSPEYFYRLQSLYPQITHIDIEWKHGDYINELTLYRYNVTIHIGIHRPLVDLKWQNWQSSNTQDILAQLNDGIDIIALKDAPNPRLWKEKLIYNAVQQKTTNSLADLLDIIKGEDEETLSIREIIGVAETNGYQYRLLLDEDIFKVNVLFEKARNTNFIQSVYNEGIQNQIESFANIPLFTDVSSVLKKDIRSFLQQSLPDYMIPHDFIAVRQLPLTSNGKIDRRFLGQRIEKTINNKLNYQPPRNETEQALAGIWQELLGVEQVGMYDNFFELGGDSILTIQMVSRMRRLGYTIKPKDIFSYQVIASLAEMINRGTERGISGEQGVLTGYFGLLPIQSWYLENRPAVVSHFNQSVLFKISKNISEPVLQIVLDELRLHHDALRLSFEKQDCTWIQTYETGSLELTVEDMTGVGAGSLREEIGARADSYQRSLAIELGQIMRMVMIKTPESEESNRLLIIIHHLAVDGVSWRILLGDLEQLLNGLMGGQQVSLGAKASSYRQWHTALAKYSESSTLTAQTEYWGRAVKGYKPLPEDNRYAGEVLLKDMLDYQVKLGIDQTRSLLQEVPKVYHTEINDLLLSALSAALCEWSGNNQVVIGLEGHGREAISAEIDSSRTVGWFTSLYPVLLKENVDAGNLIKGVKEELRRIPDKGLGYGVLKYMGGAVALQQRDPWDIIFNYLGQLNTAITPGGWLAAANEPRGASISEEHVSDAKLSVNSSISGGELVLRWNYSSLHYERDTIIALAADYIKQLERLISHCLEKGKSEVVYTPSDYGLSQEVTYQELDSFLESRHGDKKIKGRLEGLYRLSGLQQGILFYGLLDNFGSYKMQFACDLVGVNLEVLLASWSSVIKGHTILRSAFYHDLFSLPVQCVYSDAALPLVEMDYTEMDAETQASALREYISADMAKGFDFKTPPLMRLSLIRLDQDRYRMLWTFHHLLIDGWSLPILTEEFLKTYDILISGRSTATVAEDRYEDYIRYLERKDKNAEEQYWRGYLKGINKGSLLPFIRNAAGRTKGKGKYESLLLRIDVAATAHIQAYAQSKRLTINTIMQGVWALLLHHYTGRPEVVYGVVVSGRPDELPGVEHRVGMYINTLALRAIIEQEQETEIWLQGLQVDQVSSRQYQYTPLQDVQAWAGIKGDMFDSILVFENYPVSKIVASRTWSLQVEKVEVAAQNNYPLSIDIGSSEDLRIRFNYNTELLEQSYIESIRDQFEQVLLQVTNGEAATLSDIRVMTASQEQMLMAQFNTASPGITNQESDRFAEDDNDIMSF